VKILSGARQGNSDLITLAVEVMQATSDQQRDKQGELLKTGVYDLRLFRNGQLVRQFSDGTPAAQVPGEDQSDLATWRKENQIKLNGAGRRIITFDNIRIPRIADLKLVEFSAYAFNEDRVKSETDRKTFSIPPDLTPLKGRAYVVMFGVNVNESGCRSLRYSVNDVRKMEQTLVNKLKQSGRYEDVVDIPLVSEYQPNSKALVAERSATKSNLKVVLELLSGKQVDEKLIANIPNAAKLRPARPEDLLLIFFSTHGDSDGRGNFYLLPYDIGSDTKLCEKEPISDADYDTVLARSISSKEMSEWLRYVDAGEMTMIIDACHSGAAVENGEFKPGPMGSRGLGQLAYDKLMKILAATQAEDDAWEADELSQSVLSYILLREGIEKERADFRPVDQVVGMTEWLQYGESRVPKWYDERKKEPENARLAPSAEPQQLEAKRLIHAAGSTQTQVPALFDFTRSKADPILFRRTISVTP
jgi:hypothetical protein